MSYKIAAASSDGKVVNQHFGRSKQFLIFEVEDNGEYRFSELRETKPSCGLGEHHEDELQKTIDVLGDCSIVLVNQIGPGAEQALKARHIKAYSITGFIDEALSKLIQYERRQKTFHIDKI